MPKYQFIPTDLKVRDTYGDWSMKMFSKFAVNEIKTIDMDRRRLEFIASWFEDLIVIECKQLGSVGSSSSEDKSTLKSSALLGRKFLKELIEFRKTNFESCNMILILLVVRYPFFFDQRKFRKNFLLINIFRLKGKLGV